MQRDGEKAVNKKISNLYQPSIRLYLLILALFAAVSYFFDERLALAEAVAVVLLALFTLIGKRKRQKKLQAFIETVTYNAESATNNTLLNFPLPMAVFRLGDNGIVWGNQPFWEICGYSKPTLEGSLTQLVPSFNGKWLMEGKNQMPDLLEISGRKYRVHGNMVHADKRKTENHDFLGITYWVDVTEYDNIRLEYQDSRPVEMVIVLDNYEELLKPLTDRQRIELRGRLDAAIEKWCEGRFGLLRRVDRDRYIFIFEKRWLEAIIRNKFSLVEEIRAVTSQNGLHATVSLGIGMDGSSFEENHSYATLAAEMALSRGGDQAVIKNKFNFEFFGGRAAEVETRTKVKSRVMANSLARLIEDASRVYVMGHRFADLDTVGAAAGICCISRKLGKTCHIVLGDGPNASGALLAALKEMPEYADAFRTPQEAILQADRDTLLVVVDTHRPEQVEDQPLLESCNRLAVIDHHRRAATYIRNATMTLYEPYASSACELVTEIMEELLEPQDVLPGEADAVMSGIVLDTKSFTLRTGERTFDAAAYLRRSGADTTRVKMLLQNGMEETLQRYEIMRTARLYQGVAVAASPDSQNRVVAAQAADELLNIHGVTASVVLYPTAAGGVDVSARSIGDINVQVLLETLGGGGNKSAAGAQMPDISLRDAVNRLFAAIDNYMATE
ncbi:MAG: DHH family phosphoesterase [Ruminococcaceae bacterium]|nr:DHH family phosphoesterase [Oscillospiraceae bacterium]